MNQARASGSTTGAPAVPHVPVGGYAISPAQLAMIVVCVVAVYFLIGFYGKSMDGVRINQRAEAVRRQITVLEAENRALMEQVAMLSTDAYVETAARDKLNLVKPGDRSLIVLPANPDVASVEPPPAPGDTGRRPGELGYLEDWLALFFGSH